MRAKLLPALVFCAAAMAQTGARPCPGFRSAAPWLENFHHAEIPRAPAVPTPEPLPGRLDELQHETLSAVRQARRADNFYAAAEAAREARAGAALLAQLSARPAAPLFLIAFKDQTIRAATAYEVEGNTLRYVAPDGRSREVRLDSVDRALTERLNRERSVEIRLP